MPVDRWLTVTYAARRFNVARATLLEWAKTGVVESRQRLNLAWEVREQSLRKHLFGSTNAGT